jgi:hypothetical protein
MQPEPVTPPERDFGRRIQCAFDLEKTLARFLTNLYATQRLDNPTLNEAQPALVPFDYTERAQSLDFKVPPRVVRGRIPRTVTGEIALDSLAKVPNVVLQAVKGKVEHASTIVTVRLLFSTYDEDPNSQGYQDALNLVETAAIAFTSFGQAAIDKSYPIELPIEWSMIEADCFPHFVAEMTTHWQLPSARPLPDTETFGIIPGESLEMKLQHESVDL